ncbi:hypothetical protein [Kamptonema formosum]|uniref:hypothetical protein n=1 Tax=Kamptonema formosum TaxID=331992 RepID=UPI00037A13C5|nr:hypothetical protein [Oscillatoria sp. PCC 10802]
MDIQEILHFVDDAVCAKTGQRLSDLQRAIIEGILKRQKYSVIAKTYGCTTGHAKDEGYELLQMLSNIFGEAVKKKNLKPVMERQAHLNISFNNSTILGANKNIGNINFCSEPTKATPEPSQPATDTFERGKNQAMMEAVGKVRQFGLSDEQIADVLNLLLQVVKQEDLEE